MLAQEANEALPSRYCYCWSVEFIMLTQEANEALPSRYYCRCAELIVLAQEANKTPDVVIVGATRLKCLHRRRTKHFLPDIVIVGDASL